MKLYILILVCAALVYVYKTRLSKRSPPALGEPSEAEVLIEELNGFKNANKGEMPVEKYEAGIRKKAKAVERKTRKKIAPATLLGECAAIYEE